MLDGCLTEHHWMLAMAIYELLAAALNFDTIMHSSVTLKVIVQHMERKNQISICSHNQKTLNMQISNHFLE